MGGITSSGLSYLLHEELPDLRGVFRIAVFETLEQDTAESKMLDDDIKSGNDSLVVKLGNLLKQ